MQFVTDDGGKIHHPCAVADLSMVERSQSMQALSALRHTKYLRDYRQRRPTMPLNVARQITAQRQVSLTGRYQLFVGGSGAAVDLEWLTRTARPMLQAHQVGKMPVSPESSPFR